MDNKNKQNKPKSRKGLIIGLSIGLGLAVAAAVAAPLAVYYTGKNQTQSYIVVFDANFEGGQTSTVTVKANQTVTKPLDPAQTGYSFTGWYKDKEGTNKFDFNTKINTNFTLYAGWVEGPIPPTVQYTLTFEDCFEGGSTTTTTTVKSGEKAVMPLPDHHNDYGFLGWKTVKDKPTAPYFDFMNTPITSDMKLYGYWKTITEHDKKVFKVAYPEQNGGVYVKFDYEYYELHKADIGVDVIVPEKVENQTVYGIATYAFGELTCPLRSISLPDEIKVFANSAFAECGHLRILNMPKQLKTIGSNCFQNCYKLADVKFYEGLETIGSQAFYGGSQGSPDSYIRYIDMPSTLKYIGSEAFTYNAVQVLDLSKCSNLTLDIKTFRNAINLKQIILPVGLTNIPAYCFQGCARIRDITIPKTVRYIDNEAFNGCVRLRQCDFEKESTLFSIGNMSFSNCHSLESLNFPSKLKSFGMCAFSSCNNLDSVTFDKYRDWYSSKDEENPWSPSPETPEENAKKLKSYSEDYFVWEAPTLSVKADEYENVKYLSDDENKCVIVGTTIPSSNSELKIPANITGTDPTTGKSFAYEVIGIAPDACSWNGNITKVTFEKDSSTNKPNIQYILNNAFYNSSHIQSINLNECENLTYIGDSAFAYALLSDDDMELDLSNVPLTYIGEEAFRYSNRSHLRKIVLPQQLEYLGTGAFYEIDGLKELDMSKCSNLSMIGKYKNNEEGLCEPLISTQEVGMEIDLSSTKLEYIPESLFQNVNNLTSVLLPNTITEIYSYAFSGCESLAQITIPESCYFIKNGAFSESGLTEAIFSDPTYKKWTIYQGWEEKPSFDTNISITDNANKLKDEYADWNWYKLYTTEA